jgi:hypothetical protein
VSVSVSPSLFCSRLATSGSANVARSPSSDFASDAARPEDGDFAGENVNGDTEIGLLEVGDAEGGGIPDVHGRAVDEGWGGRGGW